MQDVNLQFRLQAVAQPVHQAALAILERTGIWLDDVAMRDSLVETGCRADGRRVRIPEALVERALAAAPGRFTLCGRDGTPGAALGDGRIFLASSGVAPNIRDLETGHRRATTLQDVADTTRVLDALPGIDVLCATLVEATDLPPPMTILRGFEATLRHTLKPISGPGIRNAAEARFAVAMGTAVAGGLVELQARPFFIPWLCPVSPLSFGADLVGAIRTVAEAGLPLAPVTAPVLGLSAPLTAAGCLAQMHAELLATLVIAYQVRPGLPFLYQGSPVPSDLRKATILSGGPLHGLMKAITVALGRYCGLPTTGFGLMSGAKAVDIQFGYEKSANGLMCALAGPHLLSGLGLLANGLDTSYEAILLEHEIAGHIMRMLTDIQVNHDTLALDVVDDALGGDMFLTHAHTLAHLRTTGIWSSPLTDNLGMDEWAARGEPLAVDRARARAREILLTHELPPLPDRAEMELVAVMTEAERQLLGPTASRGKP